MKYKLMIVFIVLIIFFVAIKIAAIIFEWETILIFFLFFISVPFYLIVRIFFRGLSNGRKFSS